MVLVILPVLAGCGGEPSPVPVKLTLQHKGKPVSDVRVNLLDETGKAAFAFTDTAGTATGFKTGGVAGVLPGEYSVVLATKDEIDLSANPGTADYSAKPQKASFPAKYKTAASSDQKVKVESDGDNTFTVELTD